MPADCQTIEWLLSGDPAIRWQTLRDLTGASKRAVAAARAEVAASGWGARLVALQAPDGEWGGGIYTPKWTSTTYTMLLLRDMGLPARHPQALKACALLLDRGVSADGGIDFWRSRQSETCVTGMVLSIAARAGVRDARLERLAGNLLNEQMPDGGWNCQRSRGATHSSFHTTILALEALTDYGRTSGGSRAAVSAAAARGREFLAVHRLFRSHRTGEIVKPAMLRFSFPAQWHYDVLRALDHFRDAGAGRDPRLAEAIALVEKRRSADGRWNVAGGYAGREHFRMEETGHPSRWNTLRALRVLGWWYAEPALT
jgi:hypothetical protein